MKKKIILIQKDGMLDVLEKPDDIEIEIRDYDVWGEIDHFELDEDGNEYYQRLL